MEGNDVKQKQRMNLYELPSPDAAAFVLSLMTMNLNSETWSSSGNAPLHSNASYESLSAPVGLMTLWQIYDE